MVCINKKHSIVIRHSETFSSNMPMPEAPSTIASYPGVQKGGGNAWYTLFAHALNLLLGNCIMDASDIDV